MSQTYNHQDEDFDDDADFEIIDGKKVLKDFRGLRVPMHMMDGVQRQVADNNERLTADRRSTFVDARAHRPGWRLPDSADSTKQKIYDDYDRRVGSLWRRDATGETIGAREGDVCTVRQGGKGEGGPGTMQYVDGELVCVPDKRADASDGQTHSERMQDEYARYDLEISQRFLDGEKDSPH